MKRLSLRFLNPVTLANSLAARERKDKAGISFAAMRGQAFSRSKQSGMDSGDSISWILHDEL